MADSDSHMTDLVRELILDTSLRASIAQYNRSTPGAVMDWPDVIARHLRVYQEAAGLSSNGIRAREAMRDQADPLETYGSSTTRVPVKK